jgi:type I restriction enzyme, S subunit
MIGKNWLKTSLGQLGNFRNGINFNYTQEGAGVAIVKVKDFANLFFVPYRGMDELNSQLIDVPENLTLKEGDTVIIRSNGNPELIGRSLYFRGNNKPVTFSGFCIRFRPATEKVYPLFATYLIKSPFCRARFTAYGSGTGIQNLNQGILSDIPIYLPPLPEQQAIAHILGSLDDKIELNRQMNEALEGIARALFQSWFVDFDPVRAKMEGRQPHGMDAETAVLFPDGFEDSVLGEIPRGWRIGNPQDIADIIMGQSPPGEAYNELGDGLPFYQGIRDFGFRFPSRRVYCNITGRMAEKGDVLLSVRAPVGSLNIALERSIIGRGIAALRAKSKKSSFLYYLLNQIQPAWDMFNAGGTVFGSVSRGDIQKLNIKLPPIEIERRFNDLAEALDCRIELNENEIATLAALRDILLPKLLSGELRVGQAEKEVGAIL